jgi:hypothetical protein
LKRKPFPKLSTKSRKKKMTKERILEIINTHSEYEKNLDKLLTVELPAYLKSLVKGFHSFKVGGYIPGFNDGDPCVFWLNETQFQLEEDKNADPSDRWDEGRYQDSYTFKGKEKILFKEIEEQISSIPKDFFTRVYGDCFQLIVTENEIEVNDDYYPE